MVGGACSNTTSFEELDPAGWWICDAALLPSFPFDYAVVYEDSFLNSSSASIREDVGYEDTAYDESTPTQPPSYATFPALEETTTAFGAIVDYLEKISTTTNVDPEKEMLLNLPEEVVESITDMTQESTFSPESADSEITTEVYSFDQTTAPLATTRTTLEDENLIDLDITLVTGYGIRATTLIPSTEMPAVTTEDVAPQSFSDDYLTQFSTTTIYLIEESGNKNRPVEIEHEWSSSKSR